MARVTKLASISSKTKKVFHEKLFDQLTDYCFRKLFFSSNRSGLAILYVSDLAGKKKRILFRKEGDYWINGITVDYVTDR